MFTCYLFHSFHRLSVLLQSLFDFINSPSNKHYSTALLQSTNFSKPAYFIFTTEHTYFFFHHKFSKTYTDQGPRYKIFLAEGGHQWNHGETGRPREYAEIKNVIRGTWAWKSLWPSPWNFPQKMLNVVPNHSLTLLCCFWLQTDLTSRYT